MEKNANEFFLVDYFPAANYWEEHNDLFKTRNVIIKASSSRIEYPQHWGTLSIKTVLSGHETYFANDHEYKLNEYTYLILNHDQHYGSSIKAQDPVESLSFHFTRLFEQTTLYYLHNSHDALIDDPSREAECGYVEFTVTQHTYSPAMRKLVLDIRDLIADMGSSTGRIEELYYRLYIEIFHAQLGVNRIREDLNAVKKSTRDEVFRRVTLAKDYIESNYNNPELSLSHLSAISCMNTYHFLRCFKQVYKQTPYQYLKQLRLRRAFELLKTKKYSVSRVVNLCGYQDVSSFDKTFRSRYSIQPSRI